MNRNLIRATLAWAAIAGLAAGCAASPGPAPERTAAATQSCASQTASRLKPREENCPIAPSRSYSQREIERTGQTNAADALQMLDPSITVHH